MSYANMKLIVPGSIRVRKGAQEEHCQQVLREAQRLLSWGLSMGACEVGDPLCFIYKTKHLHLVTVLLLSCGRVCVCKSVVPEGDWELRGI